MRVINARMSRAALRGVVELVTEGDFDSLDFLYSLGISSSVGPGEVSGGYPLGRCGIRGADASADAPHFFAGAWAR